MDAQKKIDTIARIAAFEAQTQAILAMLEEEAPYGSSRLHANIANKLSTVKRAFESIKQDLSIKAKGDDGAAELPLLISGSDLYNFLHYVVPALGYAEQAIASDHPASANAVKLADDVDAFLLMQGGIKAVREAPAERVGSYIERAKGVNKHAFYRQSINPPSDF